jgi:hypothetical protein
MATTSVWYGQSGGALIARLWVAQQMGVALLGAGYTPNLDSHMRYSDVSAQEIASGGGYTSGGQQITNRTAPYDASADETNMLGDDLTWGPGATINTRYGALYEMTTVDKYLWALLDFGTLISISNGVFTIDWSSGLLSVQSAGPV